jgi:DNA-binding transcriptional regulator YiaG
MVTSERIKSTRAKLGESQEVFGARFGVDQSTVHRWETAGVSDRGTTMLAVERVLSDIEAEEAA